MPFLFLERAEKIERESSKKEGRESKVRNEKRARAKKRKERYPVFHISKLRRETVPRRSKEIRRGEERGGGLGSYNLNLLPNDRLGTRTVPRQLRIFQIVTRASLKENKNSFAALFLELHRNLCADQIAISLL